MIKTIFLLFPLFLVAQDQNASIIKDTNNTKFKQTDSNLTKKKLLQEHIKEQLKKEAKYAKEKMFYMGKDYNLTEHQVDPNSLKDINAIEPDYDFDMDEGVYSD